MKITINLPLLKLDATFSEDTIYYDKDSRIELWRNDSLKKLPANIKCANEIFFQDIIEVDEAFLSNLGLDTDDTTIQLAELMFANLQKVLAFQQYMEVRFDEIYPVEEPDNAYHLYSIGGIEYMVFYNKEMMDLAIEFEIERLKGSYMVDILGDIEYIEDFFDVIDTKKSAQTIRDAYDKMKFDDADMTDEIYQNDQKIIKWLVNVDDDFLVDVLEETFDVEKFAHQSIGNLDDAVNNLNDMAGDLLETVSSSCEGYRTADVTIFRKI